MARTVEVDVSEFREFFEELGHAGDEFRNEMTVWLDGIGEDFLRMVTDEIIRREVVDSRLLLNSFEKGAADNVWKLEEDGLTLEVGTSVNYAQFVNDGHWTIDQNKTRHFVLPDGTLARFVPGYWDCAYDEKTESVKSSFVYVPGYKTGMVLKQQWVDGQPYFDSALRAMEKMFPDLIDAKLDQWVDKYL